MHQVILSLLRLTAVRDRCHQGPVSESEREPLLPTPQAPEGRHLTPSPDWEGVFFQGSSPHDRPFIWKREAKSDEAG